MNVIITGASKGIGFEVCKKLLQEPSNNIIAISRSSDSFSSDEIFQNGKFTHVSLDIGEKNFTSKLLPAVLGVFSKIDIIINNAGLLINKPITELSDEDFDDMFNMNVKSVFSMVRDMVPHMNQDSHIVNITSMGGFQEVLNFRDCRYIVQVKAR